MLSCGQKESSPTEQVADMCLSQNNYSEVELTQTITFCRLTTPSEDVDFVEIQKYGVPILIEFKAKFEGEEVTGKMCCNTNRCAKLHAYLPNGDFSVSWFCSK
jgi:uncharacterized protein (UPF0179 family)